MIATRYTNRAPAVPPGHTDLERGSVHQLAILSCRRWQACSGATSLVFIAGHDTAALDARWRLVPVVPAQSAAARP
jgi:hypothetical protein